MIVAIRTDKPEASVNLHRTDGQLLGRHEWYAHRQLSATLLRVIKSELDKQHASWQDLTGVIVYRGPGSFTGLRIGITVANALAYGLNIPIVGTQTDDWQMLGIKQLRTRQNHKLVLPEYGAQAHITLPKK